MYIGNWSSRDLSKLSRLCKGFRESGLVERALYLMRVVQVGLIQELFSLLPGFYTVNPIKLETGLRPNGAGIPYTLLLRIEAMGFPSFGLLL